MPRPKLYHTKAERREANRVKNKRFYRKNKEEILYSKQVRRDELNRAIQCEEIKVRKKRRDAREIQKKKGIPAVEATQVHEKKPVSTVPTAQDLRLRELEDRLKAMKVEYNAEVTPNCGQYADKLSEQAVAWKRATRLPIMQRPPSKSPLQVAKALLESKLMEYQMIEDEYFYATRDQTGKSWDEKKESFTMYKLVVSEFLDILEKLQSLLVLLPSTILNTTLKHRRAKNRHGHSIVQSKKSRGTTQHRQGLTIAEDEYYQNRDAAGRYKVDLQFYERHLRTLKTSLQREVNSDPSHYLEHLYQELLLWKHARQPIISPLEHPITVLQSFEATTKKVAHELRFVVRDDSLWERFNTLNAFASHMYNCVNDLQIAVYEDNLADPFDDGTPSKFATLEERHESKTLRMFDSTLVQKFEVAGL
ncbi:hypothetical protein PQX77_009485 [Marasmius sp. AFHP31]|nr:hypothetical protein PQX77_009485 [Marasmius sp. AFHP31]